MPLEAQILNSQEASMQLRDPYGKGQMTADHNVGMEDPERDGIVLVPWAAAAGAAWRVPTMARARVHRIGVFKVCSSRAGQRRGVDLQDGDRA
jgi:hypothetical protein